MDLKIFHNKRTEEVLTQPIPIEKEVPVEGNVMLAEFDPEGTITYANRHYRLMCGYPREELVGAPYALLYHPDMPESLIEHMWETLESGNYWRGYMKHLRKDGRHFWTSAWIKPRREEDGSITGYIASHKKPDPLIVHKIETSIRSGAELTPEHFNAFVVPNIDLEPSLSAVAS